MVNKHDNQRQSDATLASVTKEMDLPRLAASVEAGSCKKAPYSAQRYGWKNEKTSASRNIGIVGGHDPAHALDPHKGQGSRKKPAK